jgi:hypothetical protein
VKLGVFLRKGAKRSEPGSIAHGQCVLVVVIAPGGRGERPVVEVEDAGFGGHRVAHLMCVDDAHAIVRVNGQHAEPRLPASGTPRRIQIAGMTESCCWCGEPQDLDVSWESSHYLL